eukprot:GILK01007812.1.p1 GENE.GILK01007812.1~~GILK01007812.1.p1  ORF type:complete len:211 (-),score=16.04 GILK01007812.1:148-753(-)
MATNEVVAAADIASDPKHHTEQPTTTLTPEQIKSAPDPLPWFVGMNAIRTLKLSGGVLPPAPAVNPMWVTETCVFKSALAAVLGGGLGIMLGLFMGSLDSMNTNPESSDWKKEVKEGYKAMGRRALSNAKSFAMVGSVYSAVECSISSARGRQDFLNTASAGCITGAAFGYSGGPQGMALGCAGFVAFSTAIEYYMHHARE